MGRPRKDEFPAAFVASAVRLPTVSRMHATRSEGWQGQAWEAYDSVAELRFVANWVGNVMSRARLLPARKVGRSYEPIDSGPAADAMAEYFNGPQGQSSMLQRSGVHLTVAGEVYHVYHADQWECLATGNVTQHNGKVSAQWDSKKIQLTRDDLAVRVWTPHPRDPLRADSPVRANLRTLNEVRALNDHVQAQLNSRLAGAGILLIPSEITFPVPQGSDPSANQADVFMNVLADAMGTALRDREDASALVPIVVSAPGEYLDKVQHLTFWNELDDAVIEMREAAVKRLAIGLDTPPEVLLGMGETTSHWTGWLIDDQAIKAHLEPRLAVIAHAITDAYLRPALKDIVGAEELNSIFCVADTSQIRLRPNRSREAIEIYDRGGLSLEALLRETGFNPEDGMSDDELRQWLLKQIATGSTTPEQTQAALRILGADLGVPGEEPNNGMIEPRRNLDQHPNTGPADRERGEREAHIPPVLAACEATVMRALERAGNRLCDAKARRNGFGDMPAHKRYMKLRGNPDDLLDGAWNSAADTLGGYGRDVPELVGLLDFYVRGLLTTQQPYSRNTLRLLLDKATVG